MPSMYISGRSQSSFMSSPAFYLTGVLEKIRMVLCPPTEIYKASETCLLRNFDEDFFFSIEICTWLHKAFNLFTYFLASFLLRNHGQSSLFYLTWNLEVTFWLLGPSTCGSYVILLSTSTWLESEIKHWINKAKVREFHFESEKDKVRKTTFWKTLETPSIWHALIFSDEVR